jgi:TldD protein
MSDALGVLQDAIRGADGFVELRYHEKTARSVTVEKGTVERTQFRQRSGVGVRVLENGGWGFASTGSLEPAAIRAAVDAARAAARAAAAGRRSKRRALPAARLARGSFDVPGVEEVLARSLE